MIDTHDGLPAAPTKPLAEGDAHHQSTHQARTLYSPAASSLGAMAPPSRPSDARLSSSAASTLTITSTCLREAISDHYAAKTGMKIDLRRNLIGQHITVIDDRLTISSHELSMASTRRRRSISARSSTVRSGAGGSHTLLSRRRLRRRVVDQEHQGQRRRHDDGIFANTTVVTAAAASRSKAQGGIECNSALVASSTSSEAVVQPSICAS